MIFESCILLVSLCLSACKFLCWFRCHCTIIALIFILSLSLSLRFLSASLSVVFVVDIWVGIPVDNHCEYKCYSFVTVPHFVLNRSITVDLSLKSNCKGTIIFDRKKAGGRFNLNNPVVFPKMCFSEKSWSPGFSWLLKLS